MCIGNTFALMEARLVLATIYFLPERLLRCCGMSVTMIPGRASNAAFKRNAVWLCRGYSHQTAILSKRFSGTAFWRIILSSL